MCNANGVNREALRSSFSIQLYLGDLCYAQPNRAQQLLLVLYFYLCLTRSLYSSINQNRLIKPKIMKLVISVSCLILLARSIDGLPIEGQTNDEQPSSSFGGTQLKSTKTNFDQAESLVLTRVGRSTIALKEYGNQTLKYEFSRPIKWTNETIDNNQNGYERSITVLWVMIAILFLVVIGVIVPLQIYLVVVRKKWLAQQLAAGPGNASNFSSPSEAWSRSNTRNSTSPISSVRSALTESTNKNFINQMAPIKQPINHNSRMVMSDAFGVQMSNPDQGAQQMSRANNSRKR